MRILPCGPRARLVEHGDPAGFAAGLRASALAGVIDVVIAESTVLVMLDRPINEEALHAITAIPSAELSGPVREIPVLYDGQDLDEVSRTTGMSAAQLIATHAAPTYTVAFCGFVPGFAYLSGTDARLHLPRRGTPRTRVPAGSIAIAAGYSAVYPLTSPGGWHLLGRTDLDVFDPMRDPPALLTPGMRVRFAPVDTLTPPAPRSRPLAAQPGSGTVEVIDPGPFTVVQDLGRPGHGVIGVGTSGAFDRTAHQLANRIVGNPGSAAALEALGGGLALRALRHCTLAVTGAQGLVTVDGTAVSRGAPITLAPGQVMRLGTPIAGLRSHVALRGGASVTPVLGSRSRDTLSGLGPEPLMPGSWLAVDATDGPINVDHVPTLDPPSALTLPLHAGPRSEWVTPEGRRALAGSDFAVAPESDRIGVRLRGAAVTVATPRRLASEGVVRGAVQVPPDGQPVVLGPDHPVTGGYPVVGVIDESAVDLLAQAAPGTPVRFDLIGW